MKNSRRRQKDQAHGSDNSVCRDIGFSAEGYDHRKIYKNRVIQQTVFPVHKMVPYQKIQNAGQDR